MGDILMMKLTAPRCPLALLVASNASAGLHASDIVINDFIDESIGFRPTMIVDRTQKGGQQ